MKSASAILSLIWSLAVAGLAVWLLVERQACSKLVQENISLRQQLIPMDQFAAQNLKLSNLLAQANAFLSIPDGQLRTFPAPDEELLRLRAERDSLRQQSNEIQTLREDTRQARAALKNSLETQIAGKPAKTRQETTSSGSQFEILKAEYWTDHARMDVTEELRERIRGDHLKTVASNNIKGDPEFGQVKRLTIEYRFVGVTLTNEFREGDIIVLP